MGSRKASPSQLNRTTSPSAQEDEIDENTWFDTKDLPTKTHPKGAIWDVIHLTWVVSGFMVKMASCKLPRKESITRAPETITTPITLKFGDVWASAKVKRIRPTTKRTADTYSWAGYFRLSPGMKAPIIITGRTWNFSLSQTGLKHQRAEEPYHSIMRCPNRYIEREFNIFEAQLT